LAGIVSGLRPPAMETPATAVHHDAGRAARSVLVAALALAAEVNPAAVLVA